LGGFVGDVVDVAKDVAKFMLTNAVLQPVAGAVPLVGLVYLGREIGGLTGVNFADPELLIPCLIASGDIAILASSVLGFNAILKIVGGTVESRPLDAREIRFAKQVFKESLPYDKIRLTNLETHSGRRFVIPHVDDTILVNLGQGFYGPESFRSPGYPVAGQTFIHELVHAWQIAHDSTIKLTIDYIDAQAHGRLAYRYGRPDRPWGDFGLEQQASIVDDWFAGGYTHMESDFAPDRTPMKINDPYYKYIEEIQAATL
jgi:hypothetical protein